MANKLSNRRSTLGTLETRREGIGTVMAMAKEEHLPRKPAKVIQAKLLEHTKKPKPKPKPNKAKERKQFCENLRCVAGKLWPPSQTIISISVSIPSTLLPAPCSVHFTYNTMET